MANNKDESPNDNSRVLRILTILSLFFGLVALAVAVYVVLELNRREKFETVNNNFSTAIPDDQLLSEETIGKITTQLNELTEANNQLLIEQEKVPGSMFAILAEAIPSMAEHLALPFILLLALVWYRQPIGQFLTNIAIRSKTDTFDLGTVKFTSDELLTVIAEREKLRLSLKVAGADGKLKKAEFTEIVSQASQMYAGKGKLERDAQWALLDSVIRVAFSDGELENVEYQAILNEARLEFGMDEQDINKLKHEILRIWNLLGGDKDLPEELVVLARETGRYDH